MPTSPYIAKKIPRRVISKQNNGYMSGWLSFKFAMILQRFETNEFPLLFIFACEICYIVFRCQIHMVNERK
jgi:hypothetical protein